MTWGQKFFKNCSIRPQSGLNYACHGELSRKKYKILLSGYTLLRNILSSETSNGVNRMRLP